MFASSFRVLLLGILSGAALGCAVQGLGVFNTMSQGGSGDQGEVSAEYDSIFHQIEDFPRLPDSKLVFRRVSPSEYGPFVEMTLASQSTVSEIASFYERTLGAKGCEPDSETLRRVGDSFERKWSCVAGYEEDTELEIIPVAGKKNIKNSVHVAFGLRKASPVVYGAEGVEDTGTVTFRPIVRTYPTGDKAK